MMGVTAELEVYACILGFFQMVWLMVYEDIEFLFVGFFYY